MGGYKQIRITKVFWNKKEGWCDGRVEELFLMASTIRPNFEVELSSVFL